MKKENNMKERPIIFSGESVRAIQDGRKTMTRRVVKPRYRDDESGFNVCSCPATNEVWVEKADEEGGDFEEGTRFVPCPYGQVGDRLWVKEVWRDRFGTAYANYGTGNAYPIDDIREVDYKSGGNGYFIGGCIFRDDELSAKWAEWSKWKSPLFMPRWASRILLEITDIRVERVQDVSEEDAIAEGIEFDSGWEEECGEGYTTGEGWMNYKTQDFSCESAKESYHTIWDSLNAKRGYPWESNPWVWVVSFKVVQK